MDRRRESNPRPLGPSTRILEGSRGQILRVAAASEVMALLRRSGLWYSAAQWVVRRRKVNWEALGAIAELVGAVGVIATLGYLAIQIRQNTAVVRTSSFQELVSGMSSFTTSISQNAEAADIYLRGLANFQDLSEIEKIRFHTLMTDPFTSAQVGHHLQERGLIDDKLYADYLASFSVLLRAPGIRQWWESAKVWYHADFREFIDHKLSEPAA